MTANSKEETKKQISNYDTMAKQFVSMTANSTGFHQTTVKQDDGSEIWYQHDKELLEESKVIWKKSLDTMAVSTDGGKTWQGIDKNGNAVLNVLAAHGIVADWIKTGRIEARQGGGYIDIDTGEMTATELISTTYPQYRATIGFTPIGTGAFNVHEWDDCIFSVHTNTNSGGKNGVILTAPHLTNAQRTNSKGLQIQEDGIGLFAGDGGTGINDLGLHLRATEKYIDMKGNLEIAGNLLVRGDLDVVIGSKNRLVYTSQGAARIAAYETAEPYFGDIGESKIDKSGKAIIKIGPLFAETVNTDGYAYQVFLQAYAKGQFWISKRANDYFVVNGPKNGKFAWEIKAKGI